MLDGQRPVAIMINNFRASLPQSGISKADVVYELLTEGGITRLMCVFHDVDQVPFIGPVRSTRDQFIHLMLPLNAVYVHIGTSIYANNMLNEYSYQNIDGLYFGTTAFAFDDARKRSGYATEHCWYTDPGLIKKGAERVGISFVGTYGPLFNFVEAGEAQVTFKNRAAEVSFSHSAESDVSFAFDAQSGTYKKYAFGLPHMDVSNNEQLAFKNVFVFFTDIGYKPDGICLDFMYGGGSGYYFTNGTYEPVTWEKDKPTDQFVLKTANGKTLTVNSGKSYITFVEKTTAQHINIVAGEPPAPSVAQQSTDQGAASQSA